MAMSRREQLNKLTVRCYDDYCFYNRMEQKERCRFVEEHTAAMREEDFILPYLPLYLTTCCTLSCVKCNNLMPMFKGNAAHFSLEKTLRSLNRILAVSKELIFCELVGGEPFLYPKLGEILDYAASQEKIRQIVVVTNGTVIPGEDVLRKLAEYHVIVRVSDYGLFDRMAQFISAMDHAGVNARVMQDMKWMDPGDLAFRGKSAEELEKQFARCEYSLKCKYLCEDKLFHCARIASLYHLGISQAPSDVLPVEEGLTSEKLREFYLREVAPGCQYCDLWSTEGAQEIPAAEQVGGNFRHSDYTIISNYELEHYKEESRRYRDMTGVDR